MKVYTALLLAFILMATGCSTKDSPIGTTAPENTNYLDYSDRDDRLSGGVKMVPVQTNSGEYRVWTKRTGNNPDKKVLLLHGGPGATHEYFECFDSWFPNAGIEYYYYDQLESFYSDRPDDTSLWSIDRYVDEVEQVREALGLDAGNFYLLGHSWGGILAMEYALRYPDNLKGLIFSNMMASIPDYHAYAHTVLGPQLDSNVLKEIVAFEDAGDFGNSRYVQLIHDHYYPKFVLRLPPEDWPNPVIRAFSNMNMNLYVAMQGPSEFGIAGDAAIKKWDVSARLPEITVPVLTIGGAYDTMDPEHMEWMAGQVANGQYLHCPQGSHFAMYDDQEAYFRGLTAFINEVDAVSTTDEGAEP